MWHILIFVTEKKCVTYNQIIPELLYWKCNNCPGLYCNNNWNTKMGLKLTILGAIVNDDWNEQFIKISQTAKPRV